MRVRLQLVLFTTALALGGAACGDTGPRVELSQRRSASRPSSPVLPGATPRQRFSAPEIDAPAEGSDDLIAYDLPSGWRALAPTNDRFINLKPANDPEASCYLSFLGGSGGGLEANVNRWRTQLGATPLGAAEIAALPTHAMLGRDATLVEIEGTFSAMGGAPRAGFKLLGLVVSEESGSLFLKFTGPAGLVDLERERFLALASSLRLSEHGVGDGHEHDQGIDQGMQAPSAPVRLAWSAPAGWSEQAPRAMREVTFTVADSSECYVTRLQSDAGGLRANLDRWSSQVGRGGLSDEAFAALERVTMLGQSVPVLELEGTFTGMDGKARENQGLLAVACIRAHDSLFVKLTGPEPVVRAQRDNFRAFVQSLEEQP